MALTEVKLRPTGPWRVGHHSGDKERVDVIYRSDALFSAITHAMRVLGWMDEWLNATARAEGAPAVRLSSLFPFIGKTRLITPPKSTWPPVNAGKMYLQGLRLVPLDVAKGGVIDESRWSADGASECLIPAGASSPFHVSVRTSAAIDRLTGASEPHKTACLEFAPNAGWWGVFDAADSTWDGRVRAAFRLLADSGFGGERSRGWGRALEPQFSTASSLFPQSAPDGSWWLLSLYSPHDGDGVEWSKGSYSAVVRSGWADSPAGSGLKKSVRMIEEGSVLVASSLRGRAVDVAPEGFGHPVYRSGIGLAVALGAAVAEPAPTVATVPDPQQEDADAVERVFDPAVPTEPDSGQAEAPAAEDQPFAGHAALVALQEVEPAGEEANESAAPVAPVHRPQQEDADAVGQVSDLPAPTEPDSGQAEPPVVPASDDVKTEPAREEAPAAEDQPFAGHATLVALKEVGPAGEEANESAPPVAPVHDQQQEDADAVEQVSDPAAPTEPESAQAETPAQPSNPEEPEL